MDEEELQKLRDGMSHHLGFERFPPLAGGFVQATISIFTEYWQGKKTLDELQKNIKFKNEEDFWEEFGFYVFEEDGGEQPDPEEPSTDESKEAESQ